MSKGTSQTPDTINSNRHLWLCSIIHTRPGIKKNIILNKSLGGKCQFNNNESAETA